MASTVEIRDFTADDQVPVRELILAGLADHWGTVDPRLNPDLDDIAGSYAHGRTLVATREGHLLGTGTIVPRAAGTAEVVRMSVRRDQRGTGVGRRVLLELVAVARAWGSERVVLETTSHWDDVIAFYLRCGFRVTHEADGAVGRDTWFELLL